MSSKKYIYFNKKTKTLDILFQSLYIVSMEINKYKIEKELQRLGWTKYRLAKEMGVSPPFIYMIFRDGSKDGRSFQTVEKLARALNLDPKDLIE